MKEWPKRASMFWSLGNIMNMQGSANSTDHIIKEDAKAMISTFYSNFRDEGSFIEYFKTYWEAKLGKVEF